MMRIEEIIDVIESIASLETAAEWDNCGVQVYTGKSEIKKVMTALEITRDVINEAKEKNVGMIITHHPLIFDPVRKIDFNSITGEYLIELIRAGISVYSAHTNFDEAAGGNNDYLAALLKLEKTEKPDGNMLCRIGELHEEMTFREACEFVAESFNTDFIKPVGDKEARIKKVGVCAGSGSGMAEVAAAAGCDLFITGDIKYHDALYASEVGMCLIDAGHYGTEKFFAENLAAKLTEAVSGKIEVLVSRIDIDPFKAR